MERMKKTAQAAAALEVPVVCGFIGCEVFARWFPWPYPEGWDEMAKDFVERWGEILDTFAKEGVKFGHEPHPNEYVYNVETADNRGKTLTESKARLARVVCADLTMFSNFEIFNIARFVADKQIDQVTDALNQILQRKNIKIKRYLYSTFLNIEQSGTFSTSTTDPDSDQVQYQFDFNASGSHDYSNWTSLLPSGTFVNTSYSWITAGMYVVKAQARDEHGAESNWSDGLTVTVAGSVNHPPNQPQTQA
jgi:hypothetical protein